jgi:hypothetical protein
MLCIYFILFYLFIVVLEFELRALCLLGGLFYLLSHSYSPNYLFQTVRFLCLAGSLGFMSAFG